MEEKFQDDAFELDTSIEETLTEVPSTAASKPKKKKYERLDNPQPNSYTSIYN